ncbi:lipid kinase YegS [Sphingobium yanoikuyae]|uniref:lipid kinase YegS n=1 Tax=Sphingobium yanoikuyae TaxID=13690 RepID=UPI0022DD8B8B|nr:lipid kinase YegS [Sphingobium yanoikuyae]WBQ17742.1 lipid kinase YegS [Sphingobium yanoikuyae]
MIRVTLILHGKAAQDDRVRAAVQSVRNDGHMVNVRVTWEAGDAARFTRDAVLQARQGAVDRIIAGGGDGTVNEVFAAAYKMGSFGDCSFGVLPLGTANDFARSTGIPIDDLTAALRLSLSTPAQSIDIGVLNETPFINLVSGGFGSRVTAETDPALKNRLGGLAYILTGMGRIREFAGCHGHFRTSDFSWEGSFLAMAIGNGRQAGGGIQLCPDAILNDGELDLMILPEFSRDAGISAFGRLLHEGPDSINDLRIATRAPWIEFESDHDVSINLDGESMQTRHFRVECRKQALPLHLGNDALTT